MSDKQGWTGGPQSRGTFDIFWTCISTLALCVWSAVHPNILLVPNSKRSLLTRLGMMMVAIVFPEIIISSAWRQLRSSQWLRNEINCLHLNGYNDYSKVCLDAQMRNSRGIYNDIVEADFYFSTEAQTSSRPQLSPNASSRQ